MAAHAASSKTPETPTDPAPACSGSFQEAASILDSIDCFVGALWDAETRAAFDAKEKIANAPASAKPVVFQSCMHDLRESMAAEIERWAPQYVDLAAAYPESAKPSPTEWARDRMNTAIDKRLRAPNLDGAVAWSLMTMSGADTTERHGWHAFDWMFASKKSASALLDSAITNYVIRAEHKSLVRRLDVVLEQTLSGEKLKLSIAAGEARRGQTQSAPSPQGASSGDVKLPPSKSQVRAEDVAKIQNELHTIRASIEAGEEDYEKLRRANPGFLTFKIVKSSPQLRERIITLPYRKGRLLRFAQELAGVLHEASFNTILRDWKRFKPARYRQSK